MAAVGRSYVSFVSRIITGTSKWPRLANQSGNARIAFVYAIVFPVLDVIFIRKQMKRERIVDQAILGISTAAPLSDSINFQTVHGVTVQISNSPP